ETYYSKTIDPARYNVVRGIFLTGADLSTKFYKVFDLDVHKWGLDISKLRHVITPSIGYLYSHDPTIAPTLLDQFDPVDALERSHSIALSLENKFQTKRSGVATDLARSLVSTDFRLKDHPSKGGFDHVRSDIEL